MFRTQIGASYFHRLGLVISCGKNSKKKKNVQDQNKSGLDPGVTKVTMSSSAKSVL